MTQTIGMFSDTEAVAGINKHIHYSPKCFQCPGKASAATCQNRDVVPQVGVYTLNCERVGETGLMMTGFYFWIINAAG